MEEAMKRVVLAAFHSSTCLFCISVAGVFVSTARVEIEAVISRRSF